MSLLQLRIARDHTKVASGLSKFLHQLMHNWIVLKTILNFALKLILKGCYMFRCGRTAE
jgi:hypothetical protein